MTVILRSVRRNQLKSVLDCPNAVDLRSAPQRPQRSAPWKLFIEALAMRRRWRKGDAELNNKLRLARRIVLELRGLTLFDSVFEGLLVMHLRLQALQQAASMKLVRI